MRCRSEFRSIAYVDHSGEPCALQYRIAFTATSPRLVVLELVQDHEEFQSPGTSAESNCRPRFFLYIRNPGDGSSSGR
jgi:hypothetical protein